MFIKWAITKHTGNNKIMIKDFKFCHIHAQAGGQF